MFIVGYHAAFSIACKLQKNQDAYWCQNENQSFHAFLGNLKGAK